MSASTGVRTLFREHSSVGQAIPFCLGYETQRDAAVRRLYQQITGVLK